jgi:K+-sensing histidine kinase KdpD
MKLKPEHQALIAIGAALVVPAAVAALLTQWRESIDSATVAVVLAGTVVAVATSGRRLAATLAAISAAVWFDYFHTLPYGSFTIRQQDEAVTAAALLFVGLVAASIQTRSLRHRDQAEAGSNEIARIGAVTDLVASGKPVDEIIAIVQTELTDLLYLRGCRYEKHESAEMMACIERTGDVTVGRLRWRADTQGLPGPSVELPVFAQGRFGGRFVLDPTPGVPISFERRIVAVALADQVGASLAMNLIF